MFDILFSWLSKTSATITLLDKIVMFIEIFTVLGTLYILDILYEKSWHEEDEE